VNDDRRIALVSGANRGIGREVARQLAAQGATVIVGARDERAARATAEELEGDLHGRQLDVADQSSVDRLAAGIDADFGRLDSLVNNAGVGNFDIGVLDPDFERVQQVLDTNLLGAWRLASACVPLLRGSRRGRIVNLSSGMGQLSDMGGGAAAYRISKTGLNALTRILANDLAADGIKVNSACPGWVKTDMGTQAARLEVHEGADTPVWLATLPDDGPTGGFFRERQPIPW
jgi:NAD(P)-dependent dehydrogenase (short-subunit alcohol dehydrogenase family)